MAASRRGYDPVADRGVTDRFATDANRDRFLADPARYEPRLGGNDPVAFAARREVAGDPEVFAVPERGRVLFAGAGSNAKRSAEGESAALGRRPELHGRPRAP